MQIFVFFLQGSEKSVIFAADLRCASLDSICFDDLCTGLIVTSRLSSEKQPLR